MWSTRTDGSMGLQGRFASFLWRARSYCGMPCPESIDALVRSLGFSFIDTLRTT